MCNTTGVGEFLISHSRFWLVGPGTPPVKFNSKIFDLAGLWEKKVR